MTCPIHRTRKANGPAHNGFSLVELMVVLFVIALMAGAAVLSMPDGSGDLRREAERFAARTMAARDEAIATSAPVSAVVGPAGYYFERRTDGRWMPLDGTLAATDWGDGTVAAVDGQGQSKGKGKGQGQGQDRGAPANRRVIFDPLGLASEDLRLRLSHDSNATVVTVGRNGEVAVSSQ